MGERLHGPILIFTLPLRGRDIVVAFQADFVLSQIEFLRIIRLPSVSENQGGVQFMELTGNPGSRLNSHGGTILPAGRDRRCVGGENKADPGTSYYPEIFISRGSISSLQGYGPRSP